MSLFSFETVYAAPSQAQCVAQSFLNVLNTAVFYPLIIFLTALAFLIFLWGAFHFVLNANDSGARAAGRRHMIYGIIGLLVMVSAASILAIAANTFDLNSDPANECVTAPVIDKTPGKPTSPDWKEGAG